MTTKFIKNAICNDISTRLFTWDKVSHSFYADMSAISYYADPFSRVWNDSADIGFVMVSAKTDKAVLFVLDKSHVDNEGDVTHWTLRPYNAANIERLFRKMYVTIYNT